MDTVRLIYSCEFRKLLQKTQDHIIKHHRDICPVRPTPRNISIRSLYTQSNAIVYRTNCIKLITEKCRQANYRIIKTIRMSMELVSSLMDVLPNLKVVHLVRDPRGITNSRLQGGFSLTRVNNSKPHSRNVCNRMYNDVILGYQLNKTYPGRTMRIRYEDLADAPEKGATLLFRFLEVEVNSKMQNWIYKSTHSQNNGGFYSTQRANSSLTSSHWRRDLPFSKVETIQNVCKNNFRTLGYIPFQSKMELLNASLPSRNPFNLIPDGQ